nr:DUF2442 domain-containing protein [uncultured Arsenicibacter sp.]
MRSTVATTKSASTTTKKPRIGAKRRRPKFAELPRFKSAEVKTSTIRFELQDGRVIEIPLAWSKKLSAASKSQRKDLFVAAFHVVWEEIDEIIGVQNILYGDKLILPPLDK